MSVAEPAHAAVRPAGPADASAVASLRRAWRGETDGTPVDADPGFDARLADWLAEMLERGNRVWLAETDDSVVGMLVLVLHERMPSPGRPISRWGYVTNVFVRLDRRNAGVGRALIDAAVAFAGAEGLARLILNPSPRAIPLYARAGFTVDNTLMIWERPGDERSTPYAP